MSDLNFEIGVTIVLGASLAAFGLVLAVQASRQRADWTGRRGVTRLIAALYTDAVLSLPLFPLGVTTGEWANQSLRYSRINPVPLLTEDAAFVPGVITTIPLGVLLPCCSGRRPRSAGRPACGGRPVHRGHPDVVVRRVRQWSCGRRQRCDRQHTRWPHRLLDRPAGGL